MRKYVIGFVFGILISGGIVYAATLLDSKDVVYTPTDEEFSVDNVKDALDELYVDANKELDVKSIHTTNTTYTYTFDRDYEKVVVVFYLGNTATITVPSGSQQLYNITGTNTSQLATYVMTNIKAGNTFSFRLSSGNWSSGIWIISQKNRI